jgi:hypothetical protein
MRKGETSPSRQRINVRVAKLVTRTLYSKAAQSRTRIAWLTGKLVIWRDSFLHIWRMSSLNDKHTRSVLVDEDLGLVRTEMHKKRDSMWLKVITAAHSLHLFPALVKSGRQIFRSRFAWAWSKELQCSGFEMLMVQVFLMMLKTCVDEVRATPQNQS